MIDRQWLNKHKDVIVEHYTKDFLYCKLGTRAIEVNISTFIEETYTIHIQFVENGIYIFHLEVDGLEIDLSKELLTAWLIGNISYNDLMKLNKNIYKAEIYDCYLEGESAMINYYWKKVKIRLQELSEHLPTSSLIEASDICSNAPVLKKLIPYISLGRLCLSRASVGQPYSDNWLCLNVVADKKIEVATYEHEDVHLFASPLEAVNYIELVCKNAGK